MPRAVAPWTWRRALRDHGPDDAGFLLAMLMLATYMDGEGFAYPGQPTWARAARKSVRMLQRYIARARRDGWLSVVNAGRGGKGWAFNGYRCCVPDHVQLDDKDEQISDALTAQCGEIDHDDTAMSQPGGSSRSNGNGHDTMMSSPSARLAGSRPADTPETLQADHGDDKERAKVTTSRADGHDISDYMPPTSGWRTKSAPENSRFKNSRSEEAALARSVRGAGMLIESEEVQKRRRQAAEIAEREARRKAP